MSQIRCVFSWAVALKGGQGCDSHSHACTEIVYSDGSGGTLHQGGQQWDYRDRSVIVYQPGTSHRVFNRKPGGHVCIGVVGCGAETLPEGVWTASAELTRRFFEIRETLKLDDHWRSNRLDFLSGLVICDLLASRSESRASPLTRAGAARQVIDNSLASPLSLNDLARQAFVSKEYLRELFREEFGESITHYIIRRRIELASRLLSSTDDAVKEIAFQAGFANQYYFSRAFRKVTGQSPSQWRKENT